MGVNASPRGPLLGQAPAPDQGQDQGETLDALLARGIGHLSAWQNDAWAQRYAALVREAHAREQAVQPGSEQFTRAVAASLRKLMSYKDEYEVARLYTDGHFKAALAHQFEGELRLQFHMAPPLWSRPRGDRPPRKITLGPWLWPALRLLAKGKALRGSALDLFGKTAERRMERELIAQYENRVHELLPQLSAGNLALATQIAAVPRASLVVVAATLQQFGLPVEGVAFILAVDHFMDMGRTMTNVIGNAIATSVVTKWEGMLEVEEPIDLPIPHAPSHTIAAGKAGLDLATDMVSDKRQH